LKGGVKPPAPEEAQGNVPLEVEIPETRRLNLATNAELPLTGLKLPGELKTIERAGHSKRPTIFPSLTIDRDLRLIEVQFQDGASGAADLSVESSASRDLSIERSHPRGQCKRNEGLEATHGSRSSLKRESKRAGAREIDLRLELTPQGWQDHLG
jgi:hypothetical protein